MCSSTNAWAFSVSSADRALPWVLGPLLKACFVETALELRGQIDAAIKWRSLDLVAVVNSGGVGYFDKRMTLSLKANWV